MGAHLQTLKRFQVSTQLTGERVLADGQKLQHVANAELDVDRPNKLHARMHSARSEREIFYDGKVATMYTPAQKYYSSVEFSGNLGELVSKLEQRYAVEIPLSDLFLWGTPDGARQRWLNIGNDPLKSGCNIVLELPEIVVTPGSHKSETAEKARQSLNKGLEEDDYAAVECKI